MYQNSLHALIDASKKVNKIRPHLEIDGQDKEKAFRIIDGLSGVMHGTICFVQEFDGIPECNIPPELVKLPYQKCWFEFVLRDEPSNEEATTCGIWCRTIENGIQAILFALATDGTWVLRGVYLMYEAEPGAMGLNASLGNVEHGVGRIFQGLAQYLSTLNCCNIKRNEHKPEPSKQSVRRALGRQPLFSTWTLEIDLERTEREIPGESNGGHTSKRLHLCRGHARQHKPGQWCWVRAHVRGDKSLGMIHKDYASH